MRRFDDSFTLSPDESEDIYTVSEISDVLRQVLEAEFPHVNIIGEVRNVKQHSSGHIYFTLRDEQSMLSAVIFRKTAEYLPFIPEDGESIIATGRVTHYGGQGRTQLITYAIVPAGRGLLEIEFRKTLKKLMEEGLTDPAKKRPLPRYPEKIVVITSPTGAVIRDIKNTISRRWPIAEIILVPCEVQGEKAVASIIHAFEIANSLDGIDAVILARGGGSMEDLWAFNSEEVARAVAASRFPVVTGIGHEIDTTIADYVADMRAATPTAAAEIVTPTKKDVLQTLSHITTTIKKHLENSVESRKQNLKYLVKNKVFLSVRHRMENYELTVDDRLTRLSGGFREMIGSRFVYLDGILKNITFSAYKRYTVSRSSFNLLRQKLLSVTPIKQVEKASVGYKHKIDIMRLRMKAMVKRLDDETESKMKQLLQLGPLHVLKRGYTVCTTRDGARLLSRVEQVNTGMGIMINFYDGESECNVRKTRKVKRWQKR